MRYIILFLLLTIPSLAQKALDIGEIDPKPIPITWDSVKVVQEVKSEQLVYSQGGMVIVYKKGRYTNDRKKVVSEKLWADIRAKQVVPLTDKQLEEIYNIKVISNTDIKIIEPIDIKVIK